MFRRHVACWQPWRDLIKVHDLVSSDLKKTHTSPLAPKLITHLSHNAWLTISYQTDDLMPSVSLTFTLLLEGQCRKAHEILMVLIVLMVLQRPTFRVCRLFCMKLCWYNWMPLFPLSRYSRLLETTRRFISNKHRDSWRADGKLHAHLMLPFVSSVTWVCSYQHSLFK